MSNYSLPHNAKGKLIEWRVLYNEARTQHLFPLLQHSVSLMPKTGAHYYLENEVAKFVRVLFGPLLQVRGFLCNDYQLILQLVLHRQSAIQLCLHQPIVPGLQLNINLLYVVHFKEINMERWVTGFKVEHIWYCVRVSYGYHAIDGHCHVGGNGVP